MTLEEIDARLAVIDEKSIRPIRELIFHHESEIAVKASDVLSALEEEAQALREMRLAAVEERLLQAIADGTFGAE